LRHVRALRLAGRRCCGGRWHRDPNGRQIAATSSSGRCPGIERINLLVHYGVVCAVGLTVTHHRDGFRAIARMRGRDPRPRAGRDARVAKDQLARGGIVSALTSWCTRGVRLEPQVVGARGRPPRPPSLSRLRYWGCSEDVCREGA
jgi:hypothetical protein